MHTADHGALRALHEYYINAVNVAVAEGDDCLVAELSEHYDRDALRLMAQEHLA